MSNLDLLPRADLPVIWDAFKAKADEVRQIAETLVVTDIAQKEEMALARKTRLTLREIRIAVEHKRVELGEGHLKEIQKVNGAAKAIKEFIEPLEARLLLQETFADRVEEKRVAELKIARNVELESIRPGASATNIGNISQADYDIYVARLRSDKAEKEETNRLRIEAERKLAEAQAEAQRVAELTRATIELTHRVAWEEKQRRDAEADRIRTEQEEKHRAELSAASAIRTLERVEAEKRRQEDLRIEREKTAKLEAELKAERAVKLAEETRLHQLALAPDLEKLREFKDRLRFVIGPELENLDAKAVCWEALVLVHQAATLLDKFYKENLTTECE